MAGIRGRWPVVAMVAVLLTAGCGGDPAGDGRTGPGRAPFAPGEYRAEAPGRDIAALGDWGIGTYVDPEAAEPVVAVSGRPSPVRLLRAQVEVLGREAAAG